MNTKLSGEERIDSCLSTLGELMSKGNVMNKMVLNDSYSTEFYVSNVGYLVIKQDSLEYGHKVTFLITPEQTKILFNLLPEMMKEQSQSWTGLYSPSNEETDNV